jgi:hypothetical protein
MCRWIPILLLGLLSAPNVGAAELPTPEDFLGHPVGADRKLASYPKVLKYLALLDEASDRVSIDRVGESTLGNDMWAVVLTSEENAQNLDRYRDIASRLANPDELSPGEADQLIAEGKVIALVTCTIHSTEVGCTQMAMEFVHDFATTESPDKLSWMEDVVLLLMPSINPDGQVMIVDWYEKYLGSEYEGGRMPWLYHPYVGHDNNRDFYMLTQKESRVVNDVLYHRWFPQVFLDEHQMGSTGPRMFVPPQTDPLAPEIHSRIFRQADLLGTNMSYRLEEAGKLGGGHNMSYDSYWPGGTRNTAWWKNVTGLLTEVASARIATPIWIDQGELQGNRKGIPEYKRRANFPSPWPGGWWRLRDIVDYELIATWAFTETLSQYRQEVLSNFYRIGSEAISEGESQPPYGWIVEPDQHDPVAAGLLVDLLLRHGLRVYANEEPLSLGRTTYPPGTQVIPAAQPYRAFLLTMLRPQRYPEVRPYKDGPIFPPYDVTSWSLPISMGVEVREADRPIEGKLRRIDSPLWPGGSVPEGVGGYLISHAADSVFTAINRLLDQNKELYWLQTRTEAGQVGDLYLPPTSATVAELTALSEKLHLPILSLGSAPTGPVYRLASQRVGLFKPWIASMDEGWTRWLLERYEFPFRNLTNEDVRSGAFRQEIDVLVFPDVAPTILARGEPESPEARRYYGKLPPEYAGGIEEEGADQIKQWVERGGTIVALDSSSDYVIDLLELPVVNLLAANNGGEVNAPGTMLRILVDTHHPLGYGMRPEEAAYFASSPVFKTAVPDARFERRVVARYPDHRDDIPLSGYIEDTHLIERRAAAVELTVGKGRVVLIGFRAQHRAQPHRSFKLFFNALYFGGLEEREF